MAPRRNNSGHSALEVHNLLGLETDLLDTSTEMAQQQTNLTDNLTRCCVPTGDCFKLNTLEFGLIDIDDLRESVRIICSNEQCIAGQYMHRECFEAWEEGVLTYLRSIGRARSWSERQRQQNLWTKKGYDLVFKACGCKCGRGHLRKDLDWAPPTNKNIFGGQIDEDATKKKKRRNRNNQKQSLTLNSIGNLTNNHYVNGLLGTSGALTLNCLIDIDHENNNHSLLNDGNRDRSISLSSSADGCNSPLTSACSDMCVSPNSLIKKQKAKVEAYSERVR